MTRKTGRKMFQATRPSRLERMATQDRRKLKEVSQEELEQHGQQRMFTEVFYNYEIKGSECD